MQTGKLKSYVGFAIKSGNVKLGCDQIFTSNKIKAVLADPRLAENSRKKLEAFCKAGGICVYETDIEALLPEKNCKALGVTDPNLAKAIKGEFEE